MAYKDSSRNGKFKFALCIGFISISCFKEQKSKPRQKTVATTDLLSVGPTGRREQEVREVGGGAEELRAVEVDDDALGDVVLEQ